MTPSITILICFLVIGFLTFLACSDSINIARHVMRQKLRTSEKIGVVLFALMMPGFNLFGYAHFHQKDFRQSLAELKKFSLYRDFLVCHVWFYSLFVACQPALLWDVTRDLVLAFLLFLLLIPISILLSFFSFAVQMPNFFDRYVFLHDEDNR